MARTAENIVNIALSRLGITTTVTSLSADTATEAVQANLIYATTRDAMLAEYPWRFARKHVALVDSGDPDMIDFDYVYEYPSDCLRVLRVFSEGQEWDDVQADFEVYTAPTGSGGEDERLVCTNVEDAWVDYIAQVTDPDMFSPGFVDCLAWRLAAELAVPLARDFNRRDALYKVYAETMDGVRASDMGESHRPLRRGSRYKGAR